MEAAMFEEVTARHVNGVRKDHASLDLRHALAQLGNRLVRDYDFNPASLEGCSTYFNHTTEPLVRFLIWLENTPEARYLLQEMGLWQDGLKAVEMSALNRRGDSSLARSGLARQQKKSVS
jgi:hypothetical protein